MCQKIQLWNKKKDKIKREGLYQDYDKGGIRMTDVGLMLKAISLVWKYLSNRRQAFFHPRVVFKKGLS